MFPKDESEKVHHGETGFSVQTITCYHKSRLDLPTRLIFTKPSESTRPSFRRSRCAFRRPSIVLMYRIKFPGPHLLCMATAPLWALLAVAVVGTLSLSALAYAPLLSRIGESFLAGVTPVSSTSSHGACITNISNPPQEQYTYL